MRTLVGRASGQLIRRRVENASALTAEVYASLVDHLDGLGALRVPPFDTSACDGSTLANLSRDRIDWFLQTARRERGFPLKPNTETKALLTHLNLLDGAKPTNAAMLRFGSNHQRFHRTAEIKRISCHGTEYRRPFASLQVYGGDIFAQADQTQDFVLGKINRSIGTRAASNIAPANTSFRPTPSAKPLSTRWPTAITSAMGPSRSACLPIAWRFGTPAGCPDRSLWRG